MNCLLMLKMNKKVEKLDKQKQGTRIVYMTKSCEPSILLKTL